MRRPRLSIVMPFRNAACTLAEAVETVRQQSFADYELVAVNDRSSDESAALLGRLARRDDRIRILHTETAGIAGALNTGLRRARAEIVVRMDADDLMLQGRLQAHWAHLSARPHLTLSAARVKAFPSASLQAGLLEYLRWQNQVLSAEDIAREIYVESPFAHPAVAYRRQAILDIGGYLDGEFPEDYDLWLRLHHGGAVMEKLPRMLMAWRDHDRRLTRCDPRYARSAFDALRARFLTRDPRLHQHGRPLWIWGAGRRTRRRADHLQSHGMRPAAWVDIDPRKIGNRIDGIPVNAPSAVWRSTAQRPFILGYVTNHGARERIADYLQQGGYLPGDDFLMVG